MQIMTTPPLSPSIYVFGQYSWIINQGELWKYLIDDIELAKSIDDILQYKFCFWGHSLIMIIFLMLDKIKLLI
jgi:hypothetical protein